MKILIAATAVVFSLSGCNGPKTSKATSLRSEREYAVNAEAQAQDLSKTGQATSIQDARSQAAMSANQEWAAAAKAAQKTRNEEKITSELDKMKKDGN